MKLLLLDMLDLPLLMLHLRRSELRHSGRRSRVLQNKRWNEVRFFFQINILPLLNQKRFNSPECKFEVELFAASDGLDDRNVAQWSAHSGSARQAME